MDIQTAMRLVEGEPREVRLVVRAVPVSFQLIHAIPERGALPIGREALLGVRVPSNLGASPSREAQLPVSAIELADGHRSEGGHKGEDEDEDEDELELLHQIAYEARRYVEARDRFLATGERPEWVKDPGEDPLWPLREALQRWEEHRDRSDKQATKNEGENDDSLSSKG